MSKTPKDKFSPGQYWFAIQKEDGQGVRHQIVEHNREDDPENQGGVPTEPEIITWSDPTANGGHTWRGPKEEFEKRFKWIGFDKKTGDK
jgi:hypothetical protein